MKRGMTLIELLAVIVIITVLVAAAIPLLSPANDDRRVREAARNLNTYIVGAQSKAISTRRPFGIALKRLSADTKSDNDRGMALEVYCVEQLPPYSGLTDTSRVSIAQHPSTRGLFYVNFVTRDAGKHSGLPSGWIGDEFPADTIRPGDRIKVGGTEYEFRSEELPNIRLIDGYFAKPVNGHPQLLARSMSTQWQKQGTNLIATYDSGQAVTPRYNNNGDELSAGVAAAPYWTEPQSYSVLRQPTRTSDEPYQLPEGTAVDLRASSPGNGEFFYIKGVHDDPQNGDIQLMFTPEGSVQRLVFSREPVDPAPYDQPVTENIYLLVGRGDRIPPDAASDNSLNPAKTGTPDTGEIQRLKDPVNWLSESSKWIVISPKGRVATVENAYVDIDQVAKQPGTPEAKRNSQILTAREHTAETVPLGGR